MKLNELHKIHHIRDGLTREHLQRLISSRDFYTSDEDESFFEYQSQLIDEIIGYKSSLIEEELLRSAREQFPEGDEKTWGTSVHGFQSWVGLTSQSLQTPYHILLKILDALNLSTDDHVIDLGAGHGRLLLLVMKLFPGIKVSGIEGISERVNEGKRILENLHLDATKLIKLDLLKAEHILESGTKFFCYEFGTPEEMAVIFERLKELSHTKKVSIVGRGKNCNSILSSDSAWVLENDISPLLKLYSGGN